MVGDRKTNFNYNRKLYQNILPMKKHKILRKNVPREVCHDETSDLLSFYTRPCTVYTYTE